jgi:glycosyltransferase involved in cell wall biosynthesis
MSRNQNKLKQKQLQIRQNYEKQKMQATSQPQANANSGKQINILAWGATPYVITGFGCVMKEILQNLFKQNPGVYNIHLVGINFHGDHADEFAITGGLQNGRFIQWPAAVHSPHGANLYGQPKFLDVLRQNANIDYDAIFLFEDPFWVGGGIPGSQSQAPFVDQIRSILQATGRAHVPIVAYFPIDGIPKQSWVQNISKVDVPITYLNFGAGECVKACPALNGRIHVIPHGVNTKEFFPIPKEEALMFKRAMFGERLGKRYMVLNVNRNQLRKLIPSNLLAFKEFQKLVPDSFMYLNMRPVDVGWNLIECCNALQLRIGEDVVFPPEFAVQKGLPIEDLNKIFNCADLLTTTAVGGGWELSISQAFATKTAVLAPANTSHIELCGDQNNPDAIRGKLFKSGSNLSQIMLFPSDNEVCRPLPDLDDMVSQMKFLHDNPEFTSKMVNNAHSWVNNNILWDKHIAPKFHEVFSFAKRVKLDRLAQIQAQQQSVAARTVVEAQNQKVTNQSAQDFGTGDITIKP